MIIDANDDNTVSMGENDQGCFYCGGTVPQVFIEWHGDNRRLNTLETIQLHPECAVELSIRLLRDVHEYECRFKKAEMLAP